MKTDDGPGYLHSCRKPQRVVVILLFAAMIGVVGASCSKHNDADAIRDLIDNAARLAEEHDVGGILKLAAQDVRAIPGELDRNGIKGILWRAFKYYGPIHVLYPRPDVEIKENLLHAVVQVPFLIVKKEQAFPALEKLRNDPLAWVEEVGAHADLYLLRLEMANATGDWLVQQVTLERFTGFGFQK